MDQVRSKSRADAFHEEHVRLGKELLGLDDLLNGPADWSMAEMLLARVEESIDQHMRFEEEGGYLSDVVRRAPRLERTIERLHGQHNEIRARLRGLRHRVLDKVATELFRAELAEWLRLVHEHEHAENQVVLESLGTDIGGGD